MAGKKEIGIFELSELFGITPAAIRKYEMKGIISPVRDSNNKYRKYSSWEVVKMVYARALSFEGFSLNQVSDMLTTQEPMDHVTHIEELQEKLAKEIVYKKRLIALLEKQKKEYILSHSQRDKFQIEYIPTIYACELLDGDRIVSKTKEERANLEAWIRALPFVGIYSTRDIEGDGSTYLGISEEDMHRYGLEELKPARVFSGKMCVTCELPNNRETSYGGTYEKQAFEKVKSAGFDVEDTCLLWLYGYRQAENTYLNYIKAYFPIRESFQY